MLGGAIKPEFKPILDEFKRWRVLLGPTFETYRNG
jgi:hypothetical protein